MARIARIKAKAADDLRDLIAETRDCPRAYTTLINGSMLAAAVVGDAAFTLELAAVLTRASRRAGVGRKARP